jgi:MYXO-CTERM domain-containing protein
MKKAILSLIFASILIFTQNSSAKAVNLNANAILLHHSTGGNVWDGGVVDNLNAYNAANGTNYQASEEWYPAGGDNYPYDYWNAWVNHNGLDTYTSRYDVVMFKHCFPVSGISADTGYASVSSSAKTLENYYLQYTALKTELLSHPDTKFIVWTGAALTEQATTAESALRAQTFFNWVKNTWDTPGDNIYVWDFYGLQTEGGLYFKDAYAVNLYDSHPNAAFSAYAAEKLSNRMINVIQDRGDSTDLMGNATPAPEPSSMALGLMGLGSLLGFRRKK